MNTRQDIETNSCDFLFFKKLDAISRMAPIQIIPFATWQKPVYPLEFLVHSFMATGPRRS